MTTIETIEHVIPQPAADEVVQCAQCCRDLGGRAAVIIDHDQDYVFCDHECAQKWLEECECERATLRATGELCGPCPCDDCDV